MVTVRCRRCALLAASPRRLPGGKGNQFERALPKGTILPDVTSPERQGHRASTITDNVSFKMCLSLESEGDEGARSPVRGAMTVAGGGLAHLVLARQVKAAMAR